MAVALAGAGYDVRNVDGGMLAWEAAGYPVVSGSATRAGSSDPAHRTAMTVYLDDWRQPAHLGPVDDRWSHLVADTDDELHAFAARMGMRREWFQHREGRPHQAHYDVPERARRTALDLGAVEVTWRQVGRMIRERRRAGSGRGPIGRDRRPA